jgi:16S rRNA G966 N2-methylase RsmD
MNQVYDFMKKWKHIDLGQVFTPLHMSRFAAKLIDINEDDVVLDSSAGTGALLFSALERGAKEVCGIEYDGEVYKKLINNLKETDAVFDTLNADASSEEASEWIKSKNITKALLNPPYEKKYNSAGIVLNTLNSLPSGCLVAMFHQTNFFDKMLKKEKQQMENHRIEKVIVMPTNLFQPFVSVTTSIFIIRANTPQDGYEFYGYKIEDDGLTRQKGKYRTDKNGKWANELEPQFYDIIANEKDDDIATRQEPAQGLSYQQKIDTTPTEEDFKKVVADYLAWRVSSILKGQVSADE